VVLVFVVLLEYVLEGCVVLVLKEWIELSC
jgi:hypothetical protein